ncbi:hypothetical protein CA13_04670 [Planctomycetes bacterium CA13]|uniref:Uncharacterized protein n=1 Tax=Novipirellula herctigrandis TaxID=2527986 RepID=A0A5C5YW46_9BACT|nr:hypothetical protein CA13_04670 [Planctomycetes bacterium CA13]
MSFRQQNLVDVLSEGLRAKGCISPAPFSFQSFQPTWSCDATVAVVTGIPLFDFMRFG